MITTHSRSRRFLTGLAALVTTVTLNAEAQSVAAKSEPTPPSAFQEFFEKAKNPTPWLTWGADLRIRNEYYNNIVSLTELDPTSEQDVFRFRGRLWASVSPVTNVALNARLSAEPRLWMKPSFIPVFGQSGMEWRYGIIDNLNLQWKNVLDQPLTLTVGRQDIMLGDYYDWWLAADGTPGDGSWTFFLDSVRAQYAIPNADTRLDLIYVYQSTLPDAWLPTLNHSSAYPLTDQREQGVILYASNKSIERTQLDGYFFYKNDNAELPGRGDNADIYTVGGKVTGSPVEHLAYSLEGAYQFGWKEDTILRERDSRELSAFGGKAKLTYLFKDSWNNQVSLVGEYLSGDDPDTEGTDEMFDVLWGRWPRWSELYIYSYVRETGGRVAQLNNTVRFGPAWSVTPMKNTTFTAMYNALFAAEEVPTRSISPDRFSLDGSFRGHYLQAILKQQFSKQLSAHLWGEWIWQGDFYARRDLLTFLRAEVMLTF